MSSINRDCEHKNTYWVDTKDSKTGEPMRSGYCPDCERRFLVPTNEQNASRLGPEVPLTAEFADRLQSAVAGVEVDISRPLDEQCVDRKDPQ